MTRAWYLAADFDSGLCWTRKCGHHGRRMETLVRIRLNGSATKRNSKYAARDEFVDLGAKSLNPDE